MAGLIPPNPRQGNRLEYLAHYILSALGTAVPVLRTEDVGVDFYCALGKDEPVGITIADSYAVQLKSGKNPCMELGGRTDGKGTWRDYEIKWFLNLEFPLLFGVPHKDEKRLDLYATSLVRFITVNSTLPFNSTLLVIPIRPIFGAFCSSSPWFVAGADPGRPLRLLPPYAQSRSTRL